MLSSSNLHTFPPLVNTIHYGPLDQMISNYWRIMGSMRLGWAWCGQESNPIIKALIKLIWPKWLRLSIWLVRQAFIPWLSFIRICCHKLFVEMVCPSGWYWSWNSGKPSPFQWAKKWPHPTSHALYPGVTTTLRMTLERDSTICTAQSHNLTRDSWSTGKK